MAMITSSGLAGATSVDAASRVYPTVAAGCTCTAAPAARHWFERVLIIVLENRDYDEAIADGYLGQLAKQGASFINFHGLFHPSYPNYLAMVAGKAISTNANHQKNVREAPLVIHLNRMDLPGKITLKDIPPILRNALKTVTTNMPGSMFRS